MKAVCWQGNQDVSVNNVPDPEIKDGGDAILKVTASAICGSDLHLYNGLMPGMESGDVLGHEFMGEVVDVGANVQKLKAGDRVVVPFTISCGECWFCQRGFYSCCEKSNPNAADAAAAMGHTPAAMFGYSHLLGGFSGGQAEYVRVPYADVGPIKVESGLADEQVLFLSDIYPTGYMAAEHCDIHNGDTVAVWGCGPVGQFTIKSAQMLGAERVIAIDHVPERRRLAEQNDGVETIDSSQGQTYEQLMGMTNGRGPDACVDAVGCEAYGHSHAQRETEKARDGYNPINQPHVLNEMFMSCRKAGHISVPGVYTDAVDGLAINSFMNKGLTMKTGQTHMHRYLTPLLKTIEDGEIDPSFIITDRLSLDEAPEAYANFNHKDDECIKVVLTP